MKSFKKHYLTLIQGKGSNKRNGLLIVVILAGLFFSGCKKLVVVPAPKNSITTPQVFGSNALASSAVAGIYANMISAPGFFSSSITIYGGLSADELNTFNGNNTQVVQFQNNTLQANNNIIGGQFWTSAYFFIYQANSVIAGLTDNKLVSDSVKTELIGEAKFIRAINYFYLVNFFGNVPLVTSINYNKTSLLPRSQSTEIYKQILQDLKDASSTLAADYSVGKEQKIVPNRWAAHALLAKVYLFMNDWTDAKSETDIVIGNTSLFRLDDNLNDVFLANSSEAIWQLQLPQTTFPYNVTWEGNSFIPFDDNSSPKFYLTKQLLNAFESNDKRRINWVDSINYFGTTYYYPYKYKNGPAQNDYGASQSSEYYMVLRLAEQYTIRAEAEVHGAGNGLNAAVRDLNIIRNRAGLPDYSGSLNAESVMTAIAHENQIEFFGEWAHRWLDLKRTNQATSTLGAIKPNWISSAVLYPIPTAELTVDPNLIQNPGYK